MRWNRIITLNRMSDCATCENYLGGVCDAYPDNIPMDIIRAERSHKTIQPDQVGTTIYEISEWAKKIKKIE